MLLLLLHLQVDTYLSMYLWRCHCCSWCKKMFAI